MEYKVSYRVSGLDCDFTNIEVIHTSESFVELSERIATELESKEWGNALGKIQGIDLSITRKATQKWPEYKQIFFLRGF